MHHETQCCELKNKSTEEELEINSKIFLLPNDIPEITDYFYFLLLLTKSFEIQNTNSISEVFSEVF